MSEATEFRIEMIYRGECWSDTQGKWTSESKCLAHARGLKKSTGRPTRVIEIQRVVKHVL